MVCLGVFFTSVLSGQKVNLPVSVLKSEKALFEPNTVIFRIKPQHAHLLGKNSSIPFKGLVQRGIKVTSLNPAFPGVERPHKAVNERGDSLVDLSLVYKLVYSGTTPVADVVNMLLESKLVVYAEPEYIVNYETHYIPNDPVVPLELHLTRHRFIEAFDITQGDTNVVIGILDTGTELNHPDLNIKYNYADPINGTDDDGDGYVDNFNGWDTGASGLGDNDPSWTTHNHGVYVQGAASARTDNNSEVGGGSFKCKALPIKISNASGNLTGGYTGIRYAANHGCGVINLSWGGPGTYSQAQQDEINYAVINKDAVVIASAGNSDVEGSFFPASYENVISVSGLDTQYVAERNEIIEKRTYFSPGVAVTYGFSVDMSAHVGGYTTAPGGGSSLFAGTSYAAPVVSGAAALIRSHYPSMKAIQVMELLRVSGSCLDSFPETMEVSKYKMGRMLDVYKALNNIYSPSVRLKKVNITSKHKKFYSGDTIDIQLDLVNHLSKANNLTVRMICLNNSGEMIDSVSTVGFIDSLQTLTNIADKFRVRLLPGQLNQAVDMVFFFSDPSKGYYDFQGYKIIINPNFVEMDTNDVAMTVFGTGNIGYSDDYYRTTGSGFEYAGSSMLWSGGLMIAASTTKVSDCVRGTSFAGDADFKVMNSIRYINSDKDQEARCTFSDSLASNPVIVSVEMRTYALKNASNNKEVILEYNITNNSSTTYDSLFVGLFADWDININSYNRADYDPVSTTAYTYDVQGGGKYAGISLLSEQAPSSYAMQYPSSDGIDCYDGYTSSEKYNTMANGITHQQAGMSGFGAEVSQLIAAKVKNLMPGKTATVSFAVIGADNFSDMQNKAAMAKDYFKSIKRGPVPVVENKLICKNDTVDLSITPTGGGTLFSFYSDDELSALIAQGNTLELTDVTQADTIYVVNSDSIFNSAPVSLIINEDQMQAEFLMFPEDTLDLNNSNVAYAFNQSTPYTSLSWDDGQGNTYTSSSPSFTYNTAGTYQVKLTATSPNGCIDERTRQLVVKPITTSVTDGLLAQVKVYPNPVSEDTELNVETTVPLELTITNVLGEKIISTTLNSSTQLNTSSWAAGYYYIILKDGERQRTIPLIKK